MNKYKSSCCPLCKSENVHFLGNLSYYGEVMFSTNTVQLNFVPELWYCNQCRSKFSQNIIDSDTAASLYTNSNAANRWSTFAFDENKAPEVIKQMSEVFKPGKRVLDVGCNTGELLDYAKGLGCITSGIEFSVESRKTVEKKGHVAYSAIDKATGHYDVITAFDLIEHLYDVPTFLQSCSNKLSKDGRLVILTGNINSISATLAKEAWWYAQYPEHIVFPSKRFFATLSGFAIEKWIYTYASVGYKKSTFKSLLHAAKVILRNRIFSGLPSVGPDHVLVVLKK